MDHYAYAMMVLYTVGSIALVILLIRERAEERVVYRPDEVHVKYPFWKMGVEEWTIVKKQGHYFQLRCHYAGYAEVSREWVLMSDEEFENWVFTKGVK